MFSPLNYSKCLLYSLSNIVVKDRRSMKIGFEAAVVDSLIP